MLGDALETRRLLGAAAGINLIAVEAAANTNVGHISLDQMVGRATACDLIAWADDSAKAIALTLLLELGLQEGVSQDFSSGPELWEFSRALDRRLHLAR